MNRFLKIGCLVIVLLFFTGLAFLAGLGVGTITGAADLSSAKLHKAIIAGSGDDQVGFLNLEGVILSSPGSNPLLLSEGIIAPSEVSRTLALVLEDDDIKAMVIKVNSPGGSAVAADEIYQSIKQTAARKPVVMLMGDVAASGGYLISAAGSYIFANPASLTGSIGVISEITDIQGLLDKIGIQQETYKTGEFKDLFSGSRDRTDEEKTMIRELLDTTYELLLQRVAAGRQMDAGKLRELAKGQVYSGEKAQELGLIDELGYRQDAFEKAKSLANLTDATLVNISTRSRFEQLFSQISLNNPVLSLLSLRFQTFGVQYLYK